MSAKLYKNILTKKSEEKKLFAVLIDPDKQKNSDLKQTLKLAGESHVDYLFVGGSLLTNDNLEKCIKTIKDNCNIPAILFPGNAMQISDKADGILFLSLISGRNPDLLIGSKLLVRQYLSKQILKLFLLDTCSLTVGCQQQLAI